MESGVKVLGRDARGAHGGPDASCPVADLKVPKIGRYNDKLSFRAVLPDREHTQPGGPQSFPLFYQSPRAPRGNRSMANIASARKRARQAVQLNAHNSSLRSRLRTAIKKVRKAVAAGDKEAATAQFRASMSVIDSIADKKIIHKNAAARHKSRLSAAIKAMA